MTSSDERGPRDPFEQLSSTHRRLEERLDELEHFEGDPFEVAADVLGYLDRSIARHEADEELSLFPRLERHAELAEAIGRLRVEHEEQRAAIGALRRFVNREAEAPALAATARDLRERYSRHIELEEKTVFPAAERLLAPEERAAIGVEMDARRGSGGGGGGGGGGGRGGGGGGGGRGRRQPS